MTRNVLVRLGVGVTFAIAGAAMCSPFAGCSAGGLGGLVQPSAMDLLSPLVKDAANSYLGNLSSLTDSIAGLDDLQAVMDFVKKIEPMLDELSSAQRTLSGTTGAERTNLLEAFGPKIDSANSAFLSESNSATSNGMWGQLLSPVLDKVALFG